MTIRSKLLLIVALLIAGFALSVGVYFIMLTPVTKIGAEQKTLDSLRATLVNEMAAANQMASTVPDKQMAVLSTAFDATTKAFESMKSLKVLPSLSESIRSALKSINNLQNLHETSRSNIESAYADFVAKAKDNVETNEYATASLFQLFVS
jgi:hypothetical protein